MSISKAGNAHSGDAGKRGWTRGLMEHVAVLPWPGIDGAYLCLSGAKRRAPEKMGPRWPKHDDVPRFMDEVAREAQARITFLFDAGNCCAEWDGEFGPIQIWHRVAKDSKHGDHEVREHWFYDHAIGNGIWSQMAVDQHDLPRSFISGNFAHIFSVLKSWAVNHNDDYADSSNA